MVKLKSLLLTVTTRTIYLYSFLTGILTGLLSIAFYKAFNFFTKLNFEVLAHLPSLDSVDALQPPLFGGHGGWRYFYLILPPIGGFLTGLIVHFWAPEAAGTGTDLFLDSFHNKAGVMRKRSPLAKAIASLFSLTTGGSGGKEGPTAQIGAGIGALFGKVIKMGARAQRTLLLAGTAGGLGAIFRAPLGGALTAVEVLYKEDFESDALIPCIISSVTAYTVFSSVLGFQHMFQLDIDFFHSPVELLFYIALGFLCSGVGLIFVKIFHGMHDSFFARLPIWRPLVPALGGLMVGVVGFFFPQVMGEGFHIIQQAINGGFGSDWASACRLFTFFALLKIMTTTFTIQSGGSGGIFGPSLFIGGMLGGLVGTASHHFFPEYVTSVAPFVVVGMASFFAGVANASIAALVMVSELTGGYELLPPLMVVSVIALIFSRKHSIYKNQVKNKFHSKAHLWDMNPGTLKELTVRETFSKGYHDKAVIPQAMPLKEIKVLGNRLHETDFIVTDENDGLVAMVSFKDFFFDREDIDEIEDITVAEDLPSRALFYVTPEDSLYYTLQHLTDTDFDKVPVLDRKGGDGKLLGYVQYRDILKFYKATEGNTNLFKRKLV